ncbi:S9 family peptidase [Lysobacter sp. 5GHs7-4]|uniref:alpha/beta hydrolase family protein n=1 Tax=Lysobacter sp. 5GHs7-4 TaxID=2904253 RepID=UPI001E37AD92|nr:S9 family peptidase [Lysobacter sp. 5GHs7-4]UHQ22194.1 S9 family peptidase [Lysobacter sp. 5GHs7-4]
MVISMSRKFGSLDEPLLDGNLYAINADGTQAGLLVGQSVQGAGLGTKIQPKKVEQIAAFLVDDLPADDKNVIISVSPFSQDPYTRAERLDVFTGRRAQLARAPVRNADFITDNQGVVRFATGVGADNVRKLYYRTGDGTEWKLISDELVADGVEWPIGFSADDKIAYLQVDHKEGPDAIVSFDIASETRKEVVRDKVVDPDSIIYQGATSIPVGVMFADGKPRSVFFDTAAPEARLYRSLEAAFGGDVVHITSKTSDGRLLLVQVWSDRNPGDFYLFDTVAKKAEHLLSRRDWFDPAGMSEMRPIKYTARDGLEIHGLLTVPHGSSGKQLPLIVMPHGGPFGIKDEWGFQTDSQILAAAGYAVLQVNYRGSGGYGRAFQVAGAKQWGGTMQDDLTDATRWAIKEGAADPSRICLYGASYGAYASLMGVAKEPTLYRCAVGYVGVYDLPAMIKEDTPGGTDRNKIWSAEWVGDDPAKLAAVSPNRIAERIKVPVFLVAGGEDKVAPIEHSKMMERALVKAGASVETLYYDTEGHGFYTQQHRREYYTRLLAFLSRHLGGQAAAAPAAAGGK